MPDATPGVIRTSTRRPPLADADNAKTLRLQQELIAERGLRLKAEQTAAGLRSVNTRLKLALAAARARRPETCRRQRQGHREEELLTPAVHVRRAARPTPLLRLSPAIRDDCRRHDSLCAPIAPPCCGSTAPAVQTRAPATPA
jgi:hypothetical protein